MHMWHHVTNHLIVSNDKDSNSENRIKLRVRDTSRPILGISQLQRHVIYETIETSATSALPAISSSELLIVHD
jgi:hypothetical protein